MGVGGDGGVDERLLPRRPPRRLVETEVGKPEVGGVLEQGGTLGDGDEEIGDLSWRAAMCK